MKDVKIRTTVEFLDLLAEHLKSLSKDGILPASDYRISKELDVTTATVSGWRTGKRTFDDETCVDVANILNLDPGYVIACIYVERAQSGKMRDLWGSMALRGTNLLLLAVTVFVVASDRLIL